MPPRWLERVAASCFGADVDDSRLGDLSENYVRTQRRLVASLGPALSHLVSGAQYLASAANVMLFARAVDPGQQLVENGAAALVAFDLREKTMTMLHVAVRRLALPMLLLICSALLINSAIDTWRSWQQTQELMASVQREKAGAAALRVEAFVREIERQIGWVAYPQFDTLPADQRHFEYARLLRQVPAISELTQLDRTGREQLHVSRLSQDIVGSNIDRSADPAFIETKANKAYFGPVSFHKGSEPYLTMAVAHGGKGGVTVADINLKLILDVTSQIKIGREGYTYVVDRTGRLISHPDIKLALRGTDMSRLAQVEAALKPQAGNAGPVDARNRAGEPVLSAHSVIPALNWHVFVELPTAETDAAFWSAVIRGISLLGLGLVAAVLGILLVLRPVTISRAAAAQG
jgi:hypothetical protein